MLERAQIARAWTAWMSETPLVLAPISTGPAFTVGADFDAAWLAGWPAAMRMAVTVNLLGLPAVAVPTGEAAGLPQGCGRSSARASVRTCAWTPPRRSRRGADH